MPFCIEHVDCTLEKFVCDVVQAATALVAYHFVEHGIFIADLVYVVIAVFVAIKRGKVNCLGGRERPWEASLMSVRQNRPKTASNMLFFASEICYCVQGCHIPMSDYM